MKDSYSDRNPDYKHTLLHLTTIELSPKDQGTIVFTAEVSHTSRHGRRNEKGQEPRDFVEEHVTLKISAEREWIQGYFPISIYGDSQHYPPESKDLAIAKADTAIELIRAGEYTLKTDPGQGYYQQEVSDILQIPGVDINTTYFEDLEDDDDDE